MVSLFPSWFGIFTKQNLKPLRTSGSLCVAINNVCKWLCSLYILCVIWWHSAGSHVAFKIYFKLFNTFCRKWFDSWNCACKNNIFSWGHCSVFSSLAARHINQEEKPFLKRSGRGCLLSFLPIKLDMLKQPADMVLSWHCCWQINRTLMEFFDSSIDGRCGTGPCLTYQNTI